MTLRAGGRLRPNLAIIIITAAGPNVGPNGSNVGRIGRLLNVSWGRLFALLRAGRFRGEATGLIRGLIGGITHEDGDEGRPGGPASTRCGSSSA